jgi:phage terminase large subunit
MLGYEDRVMEVNFGSQSPDRHQANQRAYMWNRLKEWLLTGCIPDSGTKLELDLTGPGFHINRHNQLVIELKQDIMKRGVASPDDADALALTFARPVEPESMTRKEAGWKPLPLRHSGGRYAGL